MIQNLQVSIYISIVVLHRTEIEKCREKIKFVQQSSLLASSSTFCLIRKYTSEKFFENMANKKGNREEITELVIQKEIFDRDVCTSFL